MARFREYCRVKWALKDYSGRKWPHENKLVSLVYYSIRSS